MVAIHFSDRTLESFGDVMRFHDLRSSARLAAHLLQDGVYLKPRKVLRFAISAAHSDDLIDETVRAVDRHLAARADA